MPDLENEHEAAPQGESAAPEGNAPPAGGTPEGEANEQMNMAAVGQALKHIAKLLENIHAKVGGADTAGADSAEGEGTGENRLEERRETDNEGAMDFELTPAVSGIHEGGEGGAMDEEGEYPMPKQSGQEGTPARGETTPHGAMDRRSVKMALDAAVKGAVETAVKNERARAARVEQAKNDVRGVLGPVHGMDSANKIYREALKVSGVDVSQIGKGAEQVAWQAYVQARAHAAGARTQTEMAMDSNAIDAQRSSVLAHIAKISVKG